MSTTVYLIRHGEVVPAKGPNDEPLIYDYDQPLSLRGMEQMADLAESFRSQGLRVDIVFSSPAPRALRSARIFAERFGCHRPAQYSQLGPINYPSLEGKPQSIIQKPEDLFVDESIEVAYERVNNAFRRIVETFQPNIGAFVTHEEQIGLIMHRLRYPGISTPGLDGRIGNGEAIRLVIGPNCTLESEAMIPMGIPRRGIER